VADEVITMRFEEFEPELAAWMLTCARSFAVAKVDGRPGERGGVVYTRPYRAWGCVAYWTKARAVVVRQLPKRVSP
jgi:hypothetical protein